MATGREGREDRLNQRLRGAQRVNVGDDISFSFDLAGVPPAQSSSSPAVTVQPGRPSQSAVADVSPVGPVERTPPGPSPSPNVSVSVSDAGPSGPPFLAGNQFGRPLSSSVARSSAEPIQTEAQADEPDELEALALPSSVPVSARSRIATTITEEITESPAHKPGSGHRRRIVADTVDEPVPRRITISSSSTPNSTPEAPSSSSPSTRRPRPSDRSTRPTRPTGLSRPPTIPPREERTTPTQRLAPAKNTYPPQQRRSPSLQQVTEEEEEEPSDEEAIEVSAQEAATKIGQKRPRPSTTTSTSTELGTDNDNDNDNDTDLDSISQLSSLRQKRKSPAPQRQPAKRSRQHSQQHSRSSKSKSKRLSSSSEQNDDTVEIIIQRFVNNFQRDDDDSRKQQEIIPYANKAGETVVDVFAQMCDEVIYHVVDQLQLSAAQTDDEDKKKEYRIKRKACEVYREELSSRLLQH
ncbi:hypothetical protein E4U55_004957, partial [Claviceps digitariae]